MNEKIHTIPVLDALRRGCEPDYPGECAFCDMRAKLDAAAVEFILGPAYMEPDIRSETNRAGFCAEHYKKLYAGQNRLGLALMTQTNLIHITNELKKRQGARRPSGLGAALEKSDKACYVCERVDETFERYIDTFIYLWKRDGDEVKKLVKDGKGFCLRHFAALVKAAEKSSEYRGLMDVLLPLQIEKFSMLQEDIDWFINKFDYRYKDEPWKNAKDALIRMLKKLGPADVGD